MTHPRIDVTGVEAALGSDMTVDTIAALAARLPLLRFVWIMGGDNLASFHLWRRWRALADLVPMAVIDRPGATHRALHSPTAQALSRFRIPEISGPDARGNEAHLLGFTCMGADRAYPRPHSGRASWGAELARVRALFCRRFMGRKGL